MSATSTADGHGSAAPEGPERTYEVHGMTCGSCAARVQRILGRQEGVADAEVNFATGNAVLRLENTDVSDDALAAAVDRIGYRLAPASDRELRTPHAADLRVHYATSEQFTNEFIAPP